ncbi:S1C family serine protease [Phenylobacterium sp.]|uniref:S1C family serine protease n=1 Tax=Phenylobacterium sp. TaxID=1871053 RepID=UPI0035B1B2F3
MRTQQLLYIAAGVVAFVILLLVGWGLTHVGKDGGARAGAGFVGAVERAQAATVMVTVSGSGDGEAPLQMGSGFVVSSDGLIVTAAHVTGGLPVFNAVFADGSVARAELVSADTAADVAVYRATPGRPLTALAFADSNQVKAGQPVVLMGAPYGLVGTATSGIVSAVNRQIGAPVNEEDPFASGALSGPVKSFIQTDAALTAGGSGGPLLNAGGQVIGMASARESRGEPGAGLAFAIPSNLVKAVVDRARQPPGAPVSAQP